MSLSLGQGMCDDCVIMKKPGLWTRGSENTQWRYFERCLCSCLLVSFLWRVGGSVASLYFIIPHDSKLENDSGKFIKPGERSLYG